MKNLAARKAAVTGVAAAAGASLADRRTRARVAQRLLEQGPSTAAALGAALGLTSAGVRRHLDAMIADGSLVAYDAPVHGRRGRGRPARLFALSDAGHATAGPMSYDDVAVDALRFLRDTAGAGAVEAFARRRIAGWEARYADRMAALPLDERPAALAEALCEDGYAATVHEVGATRAALSVQVCQHHCPVQHVAQEFPALCEAETEAIGRLVGRHVQRLATIAHGDGVCTTHIPLGEIPSGTIPITPVSSPSGRTSS